MAGELAVLKLEDCLDALIDYRGRTPRKIDFGIPLITAKVVKSGRIKMPDEFIAEEDYEAWMTRGYPQIGDVVLTTEAPLGEVAQIKFLPVALAQRIVTLRGKRGLLDSGYLLYLMQSQEMQAKLLDRSSGTTVTGIKQSELRKIEVALPTLSEQRAIAHILGTLDDKIELNRRRNQTLEAMARALFKDWFVDFGPVRAKMEGREPYLPADLWQRFPDRLDDEGKPEGWEIEPLPEVFDFKEGPGIRNWQYTNTDQGTRFINIRCIKNGDLSIETANRITDEEANGKYAHFHLQAWDVVVSTSGTLGRSAIVRKEHLPLMLNTSVIRFQPIAKKMRFCFVYQYLNSSEFLTKLESMASGSVQKNFGPVHLKQMKLVCPSIDLISRYETVCRPLLEKVIENRSQNDFLTQLRDTLLPKLISGELRIEDARKFIEATQ